MQQYTGLQGGRPASERDQERFSTNRRTALAQGPITLSIPRCATHCATGRRSQSRMYPQRDCRSQNARSRMVK